MISRFELLAKEIDSEVLASDIPNFNNRRIIIYGNLITAKGTPTNDKRLMHFGTFLDRQGDVFDTVHFPNVSEKYPIISKGIYKITGKVTEELNYFSIIAEKLEFQAIKPDPRIEQAPGLLEAKYSSLVKEDTSPPHVKNALSL